MSAQHSWTVAERPNTDAVVDINDEHGGLIASCDASFAPLFASAPELLAALKELFAEYKAIADSGDCGNWEAESTPVGKQVLEVITKATGGAS